MVLIVVLAVLWICRFLALKILRLVREPPIFLQLFQVKLTVEQSQLSSPAATLWRRAPLPQVPQTYHSSLAPPTMDSHLPSTSTTNSSWNYDLCSLLFHYPQVQVGLILKLIQCQLHPLSMDQHLDFHPPFSFVLILF